MIRCSDNSIYTGMTNDIEKRLSEHLTNKGAKYTKSHQAEKLEAVWRSKDKSLACKLEYQIKQLTKKINENKELITLIEKYNNTQDERIKQQIINNKEFIEYKQQETEFNLLILEINQELKKITKKENCGL